MLFTMMSYLLPPPSARAIITSIKALLINDSSTELVDLFLTVIDGEVLRHSNSNVVDEFIAAAVSLPSPALLTAACISH
jgi:hypothetical protein